MYIIQVRTVLRICLNRLPAGQCAGVVPDHRACSTVEFLRQETPDFISRDLSPPTSPHLNTVEYKTWGCMQERTRSQYVTWPSNWWKFGLTLNKAIDQWSKQALVKAKGQHFEHSLFMISRTAWTDKLSLSVKTKRNSTVELTRYTSSYCFTMMLWLLQQQCRWFSANTKLSRHD